MVLETLLRKVAAATTCLENYASTIVLSGKKIKQPSFLVERLVRIKN